MKLVTLNKDKLLLKQNNPHKNLNQQMRLNRKNNIAHSKNNKNKSKQFHIINKM
jgi:hypothetical protein